MAPKTTRLTGLLHELEDLLDQLGSPFSTYALPGIDDDQIDELLAPTGIAAPTELREWWRWHHGVQFDSGPGIDHQTLGPGRWGPMDIPWALRDQEEWLVDCPGDDEDFGWTRSWLPFMWADGHHWRLVARLDESVGDEICVGWWYVFDVPPEEPVARSLAGVIEDFLVILRDGQIFWNSTGAGYWEEGPRWSEFPRYLGM